MTGVGFSESSAQAIADALGQLGSGNLDVLNRPEDIECGEYVIKSVTNLFDFSNKEISMSKQKHLFKKIIPEWSDGYQNLQEN